VADAAGGKRLVFALTTGRSGTDFLAHALAGIPGLAACHEPEPQFAAVMREAQRDAGIARRFWQDHKLPAIRRHAEPIYVETSHLFGKGFVEPLLDLGVVPDAVVLERPHRKVAASLYRLNTTPGRTPKALRFYLSPADETFLELPGWETLHDYQLCYWYCLETERRNAWYSALLRGRGARVVATSLDEIADVEGFARLLSGLALPPLPLARRMAWRLFGKRRRNIKDYDDARSTDALDFDALEGEVRARMRERQPRSGGG
jgi:hypothetical protein